VALVAINVIVYAPVRHHDFVGLDDTAYVTENRQVTGGLTWPAVAWAFTTGRVANWHPLTWLSHMLDVQLFGVNAGPHHVTSLVLHVLNTLLLFVVLRRMTGHVGRSAFVAALFAVHPLHVESVAWIAERKDVLSTLFWMLTLWAYVEYVRKPRWHRYALVLVFFALGLMAKPMLVTLPFVLLLLDVWPLGRLQIGRRDGEGGGRKAAAWVPVVREKLPLIALAAASSVVTFAVSCCALRLRERRCGIGKTASRSGGTPSRSIPPTTTPTPVWGCSRPIAAVPARRCSTSRRPSESLPTTPRPTTTSASC
jgi:hypothetical protein